MKRLILLLATSSLATSPALAQRVGHDPHAGHQAAAKKAPAKKLTAKKSAAKKTAVKKAPTETARDTSRNPKPAAKRQIMDGCDPMFSPVTVPAMAHVAGRCVS